MKVYSFPRGGISFEDPAVPVHTESVTAFLPGLSVIPLVQHSGGRAYPVVAVGDYVKEGMLIGRGRGPGQANIHATVPGRVIRMVSWKTAGGNINDALVIRMEGAFEKLGKPEEIFPWEGMAPFELKKIIAEYGIVEMEGAGRPLQDIFSSLQSAPAPLTLVVRCVFDDPWLAADQTLCRERLGAVAEGSVIAARAGKASQILYAISQEDKDLGTRFLAETASWNIPASLAVVGSRYPQRNRRELELVLRAYEKKEGISLGTLLILGPASLAAVHDAVKLRKPILDRYVAAGGSAVKNPRVIKVRIGTRVGEVFAECGGFIENPWRIVMGSPLLGRGVADLDEPVVKTSYAVFALRKGIRTVSRNCIGCGECRMVCPVGLDPEDLFKRFGGFSSGEPPADIPPLIMARAAECHGCGCCETVCPSGLPLTSAIFSAVRDSRRGSPGNSPHGPFPEGK